MEAIVVLGGVSNLQSSEGVVGVGNGTGPTIRKSVVELKIP